MALFKKSHSRSKPIVETGIVTPSLSYRDGEKRYVVNLMAPGGPPYTHFELQLTEAEMFNVATGWLALFSRDYRDVKP